MSTLSLIEKFNVFSEEEIFTKDIPSYIEDNLNPTFNIRPYQIEGMSRFIYYLEKYRNRISPSHLLFHMATGSGKTLMMASSILYLYKMGYRNFIFFVNSTSIIEKTKLNFVDYTSSKFLFSKKIDIDGKEVRINEVSNFEVTMEDDINIIFTTIQGLHSKLSTARENTLTIEDFNNEKIVLISDEAHHINTLTKSRISKSEAENLSSWESTVQKVFNSNKENILIEYTATVETGHPAVKEKYNDKIVFEYTLKNFRIDKYSKEVKVVQADLSPNDRVLQAILLSQYRKKVAEKNGIHLKPVILIKSKTIDSSKEYKVEFENLITNLTEVELENIREITLSDTVKQAFDFFEAQNISMENLILELQEDFNQNKCLEVNSREDSIEKQITVNTLEDKSNQVRVIFVVDKLNEGWDVLNLFDIVRIDESRGSDNSTVSEAQLIGRGARYFPFQLNDLQDRFKRKYDENAGIELRVLEEMHYHSINNTRYISDLKQALIQSGIMASNKKEIELKVKDSFKKTTFWHGGLIYTNTRIKNLRESITSLNEMGIKNRFTYNLKTGSGAESAILDDDITFSDEVDIVEENIRFKDLGINVCKKALDKNVFYRFSNLTSYFPHLKSINHFIESKEYLDLLVIDLKGPEHLLSTLTANMKMNILESVLNELAYHIVSATHNYTGTKEFKAEAISEKLTNTILNISVNEDPSSDQQRGISMVNNTNDEFRLNLMKKDWYVFEDNFGTSEEKYLVKFIDTMYAKLQERYEDIYLIRNEKMFQIYNFEDGTPFEPDYVMFLKEKGTEKETIYQLFIEPKGTQLLEHDIKKEEFLLETQENYKIETLIEDEKYKIIGLPFYNEELKKREFSEVLNSI